MTYKRIMLLFSIALLFSNCGNNKGVAATAPTVMPKKTGNKMANVKIDNQNDPVCGMPLLRGFEDTLTYNGKLIGFCSSDCEDSFVKNPARYTIK